MPEKGRKKLRGQPELYNEVKGQVNISLTKTGVGGLDAIASELSLSRSEFIEQIGRRLLSVLTAEEKEAIKKGLERLVTLAEAELSGTGLFAGHRAEGERARNLQQEVDQWNLLIQKLRL